MNTDIDTDILKTKSIIILKNVQRGEEMTGIIESVIYKKDDVKDEEGTLIDDKFEKTLFIGTPTNKQINEKRLKNLKIGDRVLVYYTEDEDEDEDFESIYDDNDVFSTKTYNKYKKETYIDRNDNWTKGTIKVIDKEGRIIIDFDEKDYPEKDFEATYIRKLNLVYDINFLDILTTKKGKITLSNLEIKNNQITGTDSNNETYSIQKTNNPDNIDEIQKMETLLKKRKTEKGNKTKYKLKWFYKTNYSGSKYFPLKISNVQQLSEASKYSQVDRYTKIKEGDIIKYNDPSHPNNGLLAKIIRIKQDNRERRSYYDRIRYIYNIKFEPLETYIDSTELKQYQQRYENMIMTIDNVSESKILKFRYVEKTIYAETSEVLLKNENNELDNFNSIIVDTTLEKLKKNTQFIPDYVLAKYQSESNIRDMTKLIKPNKQNIYMISHSPNIKKRESGLFFDMKIDTDKNEVEIDIYVDLLLFQSKMITQEEWDNKPLAGKIGSILSEQIKNSYAGIFNCPNRFDKLKTIVNNILNIKFFVDPDDSETNLVKKSFRQTSIKIKKKKEQIFNLEEEKKEKIKDIKSVPKETPDILVKKQVELGEIENNIKKAKRELIELEGIMKQKGGKKTKRRKSKHRKKRKTKKKKYKR